VLSKDFVQVSKDPLVLWAGRRGHGQLSCVNLIPATVHWENLIILVRETDSLGHHEHPSLAVILRIP